MATALTRIGFTVDISYANDIVQGRIPLDSAAVGRLTQHLQLNAGELDRPLTPDEDRAWAFYRLSARFPQELWARVKDLTQRHNISQAEAAKIMRIGPGHLSAAFNQNPEGRILSYEAAAKLTSHLGIKEGPAVLLEGLPPTSDNPDR